MPPKRHTPQNKNDVIFARLKALENRVKVLQTNKVPTVPFYDSGNFPLFSQEGQLVLAGPVIPSVPSTVGPSLSSANVETTYLSGPGGSLTMVAMNAGPDPGDEVLVMPSNALDCHHSSPIWNPTFDRIIYQENLANMFGYPSTTVKLCAMNPDGTSRVVIWDSGITGAHQQILSYTPSPDGTMVAINYNLDSSNRKVQIYAIDGSGLISTIMSSFSAYGQIQWSPDSQYVYYQGSDQINRRKFDASDVETTILATGVGGNIDYFWLSPDGTKFVTPWYPDTGPDGMFAIINIDGTIVSTSTVDDAPWTGPVTPVETYWHPDGDKVIVDHQYSAGAGEFSNQYAVVMTTLDLATWTRYTVEPGASADSNPEYANSSPVHNTALALVDSQMKLIYSAWYSCSTETCDGLIDSVSESGIVAFDLDTGAGSWLSRLTIGGTAGDEDNQVFSRYSVCGQAVCTSFFGAQVWDI